MTISPSSYQLTILRALQDRQVYLGTVSWGEKQRRRSADKIAKASRKRNRGSSNG